MLIARRYLVYVLIILFSRHFLPFLMLLHVLQVIVFSYTSQIFLPTLEGNLIDRSKFDWMLDWSHIAAAAFKSLFGYVCFLTFQNDTQQVITNNLASPSLKAIVNLFLVIKAILSYPLPYYAACELIEKSYFQVSPLTSCLVYSNTEVMVSVQFFCHNCRPSI